MIINIVNACICRLYEKKKNINIREYERISIIANDEEIKTEYHGTKGPFVVDTADGCLVVLRPISLVYGPIAIQLMMCKEF